MTARVGLVDRDEVLAAYDRLWEDDTGRFLLLCGPPGGGLTSVIRHLWRSEKRRRALVDLGGFPADQRLLARALLGQLLPDRKVTSAPAKNEQLQRARSFGQIISSPIVAVTVVAEPDDALDLLCESLAEEAVIFFDSCGQLEADPPFLRWFDGFLLPELLLRLPRLRVVVAGDPGLVHRDDGARVWLRSWTASESVEFLQSRGITDSWAAAELYAVFGGHPFMLDLAAKGLAGHSAAGLDLASAAGDDAWAWLFDRLVDRLDDEFRSLAELTLCLRRFDFERLRRLRLPAPTERRQYRRLLTLPWIERDADGNWYAHPTLRFLYVAWSRREEPTRLRNFHERVLAADEGDPVNDLYHRHHIDPGGSARRWAAAHDHRPELRVELNRLARLPEVWAWTNDDFRRAYQVRSAGAGPLPAVTKINSYVDAPQPLPLEARHIRQEDR